VITLDEQRRVLRWARQAITAAVTGQPPFVIPESELTDRLRQPQAVFVTLTKAGELRGCIGEMDFHAPLYRNLLGAAVAAALEDPRFPPVQPDELPAIRLAVSLLDPPVPIARPELFDATRHGIIVERGLHRALLLPQVAREYGWDAPTTLAAVCRKAGLPADAWRWPDTRLQVFTAFDFGESK
jgi:AmmeMemoRadiSam system protein A